MMITFDNVSFSYSSDSSVFTNLRVGIEARSKVLIVGRNGAGKSTFLRLLNGILHPTGGSVSVNGFLTSDHPTSRLAAEASVTFQNPSHQLFASTVQSEAEFAPKSLGRENPRDLAHQALQLFHLDAQAKSHPYDLSLSGRKLLSLASAAASAAPILAFDEPSVNLSRPEQQILIDGLDTLHKKGTTLLLVSHDLELFLPHCTHVLILQGGGATFYDSPLELLHNQTLLRRSGVRLPLVHRLRPHYGLTEFPESAPGEA